MRKQFLAFVVIAMVAAACGADGELGDAGGAADGNQDPEAVVFVDLTREAATDLAVEQGRPWRIGREDDEVFAFDAELVVGRITFEIDADKVTSASIERNTPPRSSQDIVEDPARAGLIADSVKRLLTVDNGFGDVDPFDDIRIGGVIGTDPDQPLRGLDRELIAAALMDFGTVRYVDDADAEIEALFGSSPTGVAVVSVDRLLMLDDRAEVEMRLWCGSLCGVFLTYEATPHDGVWEIAGTVGPIAMS